MLNIDEYWETQLIVYGIYWLFDWLKFTLILFFEMYIDFILCIKYDLS